MSLKDKIKDIIEANHKSSGGHSGTSVISLLIELKTEFKTIKPLLTELKNEKFFIVKKGKNGILLFRSNKKHSSNSIKRNRNENKN